MPLVFFMAPNDPKMLKTIEAISRPPSQHGLTSDGLVHRYNVERSPDGVGGDEGTFNMCSFWLVEALTRAGQIDPVLLDKARLLFERMLGYANHLGLYAEETGSSGEALGNFPQAFTHLALIQRGLQPRSQLGPQVMLILGIETSGTRGSIALFQNGACLAEAELEAAPRRHAQTLVTEIRDLFSQQGLRIPAIEAVAVSVGPGSFTGLRVGVVCAKTLAFATGARLAAVDTPEAIAANSPPDVKMVHVITDAQRGDLFAGTYRRTAEGDWLREGPLAIAAGEAWFQGFRPETS